MVDKEVVVLDARPTGDPLVDQALARIVEDNKPRKPGTAGSSGDVEPRTAALCALVAATDLDKKVFAELDRRQVKARLKEIGQGAWAATAVKKSIEEVQAAGRAGN